MKEALNFLGLGDLDPESETFLEDFKTGYNDKHIARDKVLDDDSIVNSVVGKHLGALGAKIKKTTKAIVGDFAENSFEGIDKADDLLVKSSEVITAFLEDKTKSLQEGLSKTTSKKEEELSEKYNQLYTLSSRKDEQINLLEEKVEAGEKSRKDEIDSFKLNIALGDIRKRADLKVDMSEIEVNGFDALIDNKYNFGLLEDGVTTTVSDKSGKPISNPNDATKNLTPLDVYNLEAMNNKLGKVKVESKSEESQRFVKPDNSGGRGRAHPNAL